MLKRLPDHVCVSTKKIKFLLWNSTLTLAVFLIFHDVTFLYRGFLSFIYKKIWFMISWWEFFVVVCCNEDKATITKKFSLFWEEIQKILIYFLFKIFESKENWKRKKIEWKLMNFSLYFYFFLKWNNIFYLVNTLGVFTYIFVIHGPRRKIWQKKYIEIFLF